MVCSIKIPYLIYFASYKALEDRESSVRDAFADALGALLALGLNPQAQVYHLVLKFMSVCVYYFFSPFVLLSHLTFFIILLGATKGERPN